MDNLANNEDPDEMSQNVVFHSSACTLLAKAKRELLKSSFATAINMYFYIGKKMKLIYI